MDHFWSGIRLQSWEEKNWLNLLVHVWEALPLSQILLNCITFLFSEMNTDPTDHSKSGRFVSYSIHKFSHTICFLKSFNSTFSWFRSFSVVFDENLSETKEYRNLCQFCKLKILNCKIIILKFLICGSRKFLDLVGTIKNTGTHPKMKL